MLLLLSFIFPFFFQEMTDELLSAQAFAFFAAGYETSSSTIRHALYELAQNHTVQNKLREEINQELRINNGKLVFEGVKKMEYLKKVFQGKLLKEKKKLCSNKFICKNIFTWINFQHFVFLLCQI